MNVLHRGKLQSWWPFYSSQIIRYVTVHTYTYVHSVWDEFGPPHLPLWGANSLLGTSNISHLPKQASVLPFSIILMIFM